MGTAMLRTPSVQQLQPTVVLQMLQCLVRFILNGTCLSRKSFHNYSLLKHYLKNTAYQKDLVFNYILYTICLFIIRMRRFCQGCLVLIQRCVLIRRNNRRAFNYMNTCILTGALKIKCVDVNGAKETWWFLQRKSSWSWSACILWGLLFDFIILLFFFLK